jgi:hypothetical protein
MTSAMVKAWCPLSKRLEKDCTEVVLSLDAATKWFRRKQRFATDKPTLIFHTTL